MGTISWEDFEKIDIRTGTVISVSDFPNARKPAYKLEIEFGPELGLKRSSAQLTHFYTPEDIIGKQVVAVVNFPLKQIGNFFSECLVLGIYNADNNVVLLHPERKVPDGSKIG
jgi:tRNA-binding protein